MVSSNDEADAAREVLLSLICSMLAVFWPRTQGSPEDARQKTQDRRQKAEGRTQKTEDRSRESGVGSRESGVQESGARTPNSEPHHCSCRRVTYKIFSRTAIFAHREPG